jgi:hypothetical protein
MLLLFSDPPLLLATNGFPILLTKITLRCAVGPFPASEPDGLET